MPKKLWTPIVDGKRVCIVCNTEKPVNEYYSRHNCIAQICIDCHNKKRREKHLQNAITEGRELRNLKKKICISCNIEKERNIENFTTRGRAFANVCRSCTDEIVKENRDKKINKGPDYPDKIRICTRCKNGKPTSEFYYSTSHQLYRDPCIKCWGLKYYNKEKREKYESGRQDRSRRLLTSYRVFDSKKNLEFQLDIEFIRTLLKQPCIYCQYPATGLDRIDNSKGHTTENCLPCCWECNTARMSNFTVEEMMIIGKGIKEVKNNRYKDTTV